MSKKNLAIRLSKLRLFDNPKTHLEQYPTPSEAASEIIWDALLQGLIEDKIVVDLCAGTGILGIGAALVGAKKVMFIEKDPDVIPLLKENLAKEDIENYEIIVSDAKDAVFEADLVLCNPPFGTKEHSADSEILFNALKGSAHCYSFHKSNTLAHIAKVVQSSQAQIVREFHFLFKLKATMKQHKKSAHPVEVSCIHSTKDL